MAEPSLHCCVVACGVDKARALVCADRRQPFLFPNLTDGPPLIAHTASDGLGELLRRYVPPDLKFRVFDAEDKVVQLTIASFLEHQAQGLFAYLETGSIDPQCGRGAHLLDHLPADWLSPRPLGELFPDDTMVKVRCYIRLASSCATPYTVPAVALRWIRSSHTQRGRM